MITITIWWHNRLFASSINVSAQEEEKVQYACKISCILFSLQKRYNDEGVDRCAVIVHAWPLSTCYMQMCLPRGRASPKCVCNWVLSVRNGQCHWPCPFSPHLDKCAWLRTHFVVVLPLLNHGKGRGDDVYTVAALFGARCALFLRRTHRILGILAQTKISSYWCCKYTLYLYFRFSSLISCCLLP